MMILGRSAVLMSALAVGALLTTGSTYAAFSDYAEVTGNQVSAGTVVVGGEGGTVPALSFTDLQPGTTTPTQTMHLQYSGTVAADLWVELEPGSAADALCSNVGGTWSAKPGGSLLVTIGQTELDYCAALDGQPFPVATDVPPSTPLDIVVGVQLASGADSRYSGLHGVDGIVVKALQAGGQGFSDYVRGTITIGVGAIAPAVPAECAGIDFDASTTLYLTDSGVFETPKRPANGRGYLIIGTDGDDTITGSNQADCIVGGGGNDHLIGGNQGDVLLGGDGDDVLNGGGGDDANGNSGGNGKDWLYGGAGDDQLYGSNGGDHLDGGDDVHGDVCVGGNGPDTFVGCESDGSAPSLSEVEPGAVGIAAAAATDGDTATELGFVDPETARPGGVAVSDPSITEPKTPATPEPSETSSPGTQEQVSGAGGPEPAGLLATEAEAADAEIASP